MYRYHVDRTATQTHHRIKQTVTPPESAIHFEDLLEELMRRHVVQQLTPAMKGTDIR